MSRTGTMDAKLHCSRQELKVTFEYSGLSAEEGAMRPGGREGGAIKPLKKETHRANKNHKEYQPVTFVLFR